MLMPQVAGVPAPVPSLFAEPYWEGCRRGELRFQRCGQCGVVPPLPAPICPRCHLQSLGWQRSAGTGSLYSWTVVWRPQNPAFTVPYAPSIVTLDEGFRLLTAMVACRPEDLTDGLAVAVEFHAVDDEITLPFFHPR